MAFPLDEAAIVTTIVEAILYGFSLLLFGLTIQVLLERGWERRQHDRLMLGVSVLLFTLSTIHMITVIILLINGLVIDRDEFPGGTVAYFSQPSVFPFVFKSAIYAAQTLTGDAILIYRCYILWQSIWVVALPFLMWFAVLATGIGAVTFCALTPVSGAHSGVFATHLGQWITAFYSSTLATNLITTSLLAYKIWTINRRIASMRQRSLMHVARIVVDAGTLYSMSLIVSIATYAVKANIHLIVDAVTQVIAISFYMIIIRVSRASSKLRNTSGQGSTVHSAAPNFRSAISSNQQYPMSTLGPVHISKIVERDEDYCLSVDTTGDVSDDLRDRSGAD
ncbi:hypothetical protein OBBRIDRAFT_835928 [Obba rivulosa]|uniref:Uncharacterized protein n=1 Tax=Obba rivulosa TaxID=1052685 RepID=A0A8E2AWA9_9APHY|nr:hypothetical protein OBBRIDRAFT_835928 [Obba rivulosa]